MQHWRDELRADLHHRKQAQLLRSLSPLQHDGPYVIDPHTRDRMLNLASNDYLALAGHPALRQAAIAAIEQHGCGSGASRLVSGHHPTHAACEATFAQFKHAEASLLLPTGFMANLAVLTTLAEPGDLICIDKLTHASLIDAARASAAEVRVYPHLQPTKAARLLQKHLANTTINDEGRQARRLIVTDSVFSMDGDVADLPTLCHLAETHDALLIVDEAHGTGVLGESGAGLCELQDVTDRVHIVISTASKALGSLGGIVTAERLIIDTLINRARPFIYTTGVPPAQAASITAAVEVIRAESWRRERVLALAARVAREAEALGLLPTGFARQPGRSTLTPILPLITGSAASALKLAAFLKQRGFHAPAIRPPTVAPNQARVRVSLRADFEDAHVNALIETLHAASRDGISTEP